MKSEGQWADRYLVSIEVYDNATGRTLVLDQFNCGVLWTVKSALERAIYLISEAIMLDKGTTPEI